MIPLTLMQIAEACKGQLIGDDLTIESVSTDTRVIENAGLFIALKGERFDAHNFVQSAVDNGALALLVEKHIADVDVPQVVAADTRLALGSLGQLVKSLVNVKSVAITGSCGKTTVKELLLAICSQAGKTLATKGNFNNDIGVPLTLLRLSQDDEYAVLELGANHIGEIAYTVSLVDPDVSLVNNVQGAHLEGFGSLSGVAQAKGEIYSGLRADGVAVINLDCTHLSHWYGSLEKLQTFSFGVEDNHGADLSANNITFDALQNPAFELVYQDKAYPITLSIPGTHNVSNALAAAACALSIGIDISSVVAGLNSEVAVKGRLNLIKVSDDVTVIDDTYNANTASMKAGLDVLANMPGHKVFVMGDMAELGDYARREHQEVGEYARSVGVDDIFTLGQFSLHAQAGHDHKHHFSDLDSLNNKLLAHLAQINEQPVAILVKGSRSAGMERVVEKIKTITEVQPC